MCSRKEIETPFSSTSLTEMCTSPRKALKPLIKYMKNGAEFSMHLQNVQRILLPPKIIRFD